MLQSKYNCLDTTRTHFEILTILNLDGKQYFERSNFHRGPFRRLLLFRDDDDDEYRIIIFSVTQS